MSAGMQDELSSSERRPRHAGLWVRFPASVLDIIIMGVPVYLAVSLFYGFRLETERIISAEDLVQLGLLGVITVLLWVNWDGRTPGTALPAAGRPPTALERRESNREPEQGNYHRETWARTRRCATPRMEAS